MADPIVEAVSAPGVAPAPAYYATGAGRWRDVRAVLHPPYTAWHLSYVVIGALVARHVNWATLGGAVLAFFLAVGIAAHALDELRGRPLSTRLTSRSLGIAAVVGLGGAIAIGVVGVTRVGPGLLIFVVVGAVLVLGYNLELFGGRLHTDVVFALGWGAFPVLTAAFAEQRAISSAAIAFAAAAALLAVAQRCLSSQARTVRRKVVSLEGRAVFADGSARDLDRSFLLRPLERALRAMSWSVVLLAVGLVLGRLFD